jgi:hypothetical protein
MPTIEQLSSREKLPAQTRTGNGPFSSRWLIYTILKKRYERGGRWRRKKKELEVPSPSRLTTNVWGAEQGWHCQVERKRKAVFFFGGKSDEGEQDSGFRVGCNDIE